VCKYNRKSPLIPLFPFYTSGINMSGRLYIEGIEVTFRSQGSLIADGRSGVLFRIGGMQRGAVLFCIEDRNEKARLPVAPSRIPFSFHRSPAVHDLFLLICQYAADIYSRADAFFGHFCMHIAYAIRNFIDFSHVRAAGQ